MKLSIIKPDATLFDGDASLVQLPGSNGLFEIMDRHAPLLATLTKGSIRVVAEGGEQRFEIRGGVAQVCDNIVNILVQ
ncbi:MAG: F0F1 ATP synthase subunit epsilon [Bacteroidales bacterium]|nr:F0F1 ATP synthase subunit epsilon [Bacteroidales bacterium]